MSVNGDYGLMVQVPEGMVQRIVTQYFADNSEKFTFRYTAVQKLARYGIEQTIVIDSSLFEPRVTLVVDRNVLLNFECEARIVIRTSLAPLPGGDIPEPVPDLPVTAKGALGIEIAPKTQVAGDRRYLALELSDLSVAGFSVSIDGGTIQLSPELSTMIETMVRRALLSTLTQKVRRVPITWLYKPSMGYKNGQARIDLNHRMVASGDQRAVALLFQIDSEPVKPDEVRYALATPEDVGIFFDQHFLDLLTAYASRKLIGTPYAILSGKERAHLVIDAANISIDLASRGLRIHTLRAYVREWRKWERRVTRTICYLTLVLKQVCNKVFDLVLEEVLQIDRPFDNITGFAKPYIDNHQIRINKDESDITVDLPNWLKVLAFVAIRAIIPLSFLTSIILMAIGDMFLGKFLGDIVEDHVDIDTFIDEEIPNTGYRAVGIARDLVWPPATMGLMVRVDLRPR